MLKIDEIYDRVDIETAYIGGKSLTEYTDYDRMRTLHADRNLLGVFVADAVGELSAAASKRIRGIRRDAGSITVEIEIRHGIASGVRDMLMSYFTAYLLERWYLVLGLEREASLELEKRKSGIGSLEALGDEVAAEKPETPGRIAAPRRISVF